PVNDAAAAGWTLRLRSASFECGCGDVLRHASDTVHDLRREYKRFSMPAILVLTTLPNDDSTTAELARTLIVERLAACVNVHGPMASMTDGRVGSSGTPSVRW